MSGNCAEFHIIGNVVRIVPLDTVLKIVVAANLRAKKKNEWVDDTHFNTVNIWDKNTQDYIKNEIQIGDLVRIEGRLRQSDYEDKKTSEKVYTVDLHADTFNRLAKKKET